MTFVVASSRNRKSAYVTMVQRAMDVRILLHMGSKYLLAGTTLKVFRIAGIAALMWFIAVRLFTHHHDPLTSTFWAVVLLVFGFLLLKSFSAQLLSKDPILLSQVFDRIQLLLGYPPIQADCDEPKRIQAHIQLRQTTNDPPAEFMYSTRSQTKRAWSV